MPCLCTRTLPASTETDLRAALDGDRGAWRRFYREYNPFIGRCVGRVLRQHQVRLGPQDIDDLVGEVWVSLLRRDAVGLRRYDPGRGRSLASWLRLLATRTTIPAASSFPFNASVAFRPGASLSSAKTTRFTCSLFRRSRWSGVNPFVP